MCIIIVDITIFTTMNYSMLIRIIESLWHDYIYVISLSFAAPVLVLARAKANLSRVYAHRTVRSLWIYCRCQSCPRLL